MFQCRPVALDRRNLGPLVAAVVAPVGAEVAEVSAYVAAYATHVWPSHLDYGQQEHKLISTDMLTR